MTADQLLGEWRQVSPAAGGHEVFLLFLDGGRLIWRVEGEVALAIELTWSVRGDLLLSQRGDDPEQEFRILSISQKSLRLEQQGAAYEYVRSVPAEEEQS